MLGALLDSLSENSEWVLPVENSSLWATLLTRPPKFANTMMAAAQLQPERDLKGVRRKLVFFTGTVSYTHLTLPTKRIV